MSDRLKCNPRFCPRCACTWEWPAEGDNGTCAACGVEFEIAWDHVGGVLENLQMEGKGITNMVVVAWRVNVVEDEDHPGPGSDTWGHAVFYWPRQTEEWEPKFDLSRNFVRAGGTADAPYTEYTLGTVGARFQRREHRLTLIPEDWQTG